MKTILIFLTLCFGIAVAQADLVMELQLSFYNMKLIVKIKGDKIRTDTGGISRIVDLKTGENFILDHGLKRIANQPILSGLTNIVTKAEWPTFQDTVKTEMLNGYETEIYNGTNSAGMLETLWVAKNYPNFEKIKSDLSKLNERDDKRFLPEFSSLSGMPLKLLIKDSGNRSDVLLLLSAKEEPIDDSAFEVPKDYHLYSTNAPVASANEAVSTTNEPPVK